MSEWSIGAGDEMSTTDMFDNFIRPCLLCGTTIHVVSGQEQPHDCTDLPEADRVAYAWWQGYCAAKTTPQYPPRTAAEAKVARVEALADEWERTTVKARPAFLAAADELRAALSGDAP